MKLAGSCSCGAVAFTVASHTPYPYMRCYCSICRKTAGGGGYAINIMGTAASLRMRGKKFVSVFRARVREKNAGARHACRRRAGISARNAAARSGCGTRAGPEFVYPFASAIDTKLPKPAGGSGDHARLTPRRGRRFHAGAGIPTFREYPKEGIADWHDKRGLTVK